MIRLKTFDHMQLVDKLKITIFEVHAQILPR